MINYSLAKQLKDAGFPIVCKNKIKHNDRLCDIDGYFCIDCIRPTLSEILDACGDEFIELGKGDSSIDYKWAAQARKQDGLNPFTVGHGKTHWEAVAKLYIKLNDKRNNNSK